MSNPLKVLMSSLLVLLFVEPVFAKEVYRCEVNGTTAYQSRPCKNKTTQTVACVSYAKAINFKNSLAGEKCLDNGVNSDGYNGSSSSYSGSTYSSASSYSSGTRSQKVSGYTRKDGTYVKSYTRSRR